MKRKFLFICMLSATLSVHAMQMEGGKVISHHESISGGIAKFSISDMPMPQKVKKLIVSSKRIEKQSSVITTINSQTTYLGTEMNDTYAVFTGGHSIRIANYSDSAHTYHLTREICVNKICGYADEYVQIEPNHYYMPYQQSHLMYMNPEHGDYWVTMTTYIDDEAGNIYYSNDASYSAI